MWGCDHREKEGREVRRQNRKRGTPTRARKLSFAKKSRLPAVKTKRSMPAALHEPAGQLSRKGKVIERKGCGTIEVRGNAHTLE